MNIINKKYYNKYHRKLKNQSDAKILWTCQSIAIISKYYSKDYKCKDVVIIIASIAILIALK